jgi:hypothetical protein
VQGGVIRRGNAIFVGQGTFGSGGERIIRLSDAGRDDDRRRVQLARGMDFDTTTGASTSSTTASARTSAAATRRPATRSITSTTR